MKTSKNLIESEFKALDPNWGRGYLPRLGAGSMTDEQYFELEALSAEETV